MLRSRLVREGSVGLFLLLGLIVFGGIIFFLKGHKFQNSNYQLKLLFENAGGLREGGRVFFRGVGVGRIVAINPSSNGVEILTEINGQLRIPSSVRVSTIRSGLLGDVSVNIIPKNNLTDEAKKINPFDKNCTNKSLILCDQELISAQSSPDLIETLANLADRFNDDNLFNNLNNAIVGMNQTTEKVSNLTDNISKLTTQFSQDFKTISTAAGKVGNTLDRVNNTADSFSRTADSVTRTADVTTEQVKRLGDDYSNIATEISSLSQNMNETIQENRSNLSTAIANLSKTSLEVSQLAKNADNLVNKVNSADVEKIAKNLEQSSKNFTEISNNLLAISQELNNPTNLVTLQQTLDSARVTFANTAKITSEIEEFTGDPEFRRNLRKLVNGLSNLVSYTELLEKQVELATLLEEVEQVSQENSSPLPHSQNIKFGISKKQFPTAIYLKPENNQDTRN